MWYDVHVESLLNIRGSSKNLASIGITEKNNSLREFSTCKHKSDKNRNLDDFYSIKTTGWTILYPALSTQITFFDNKAGIVFVQKFYLEKRTKNFLKYLSYIGEYGPDNVRCEFPETGRKYYINKISTSGSLVKSILATDIDWPFPGTYYKSISSTVRAFSFFYPNLSTSQKNLF